MNRFKTYSDFYTWYPGFFSRSNKKFFGDQKYKCWRGHLIVVTTKKLSTGSFTSYVVYRPYVNDNQEQDLLCIGHANNLMEARGLVAVNDK